MREKTFRVPTVRELLHLGGVRLEGKVNANFVLQALNSGFFRMAPNTYRLAIPQIETLGREGGFLIFPEDFGVPGEDSNHGVKSLADLAKIDSQPVLRQITGRLDLPAGFTNALLQDARKWPRSYIRRASDACDVEAPKMGYYWVGSDDHARATTWTRNTTGAEMQVMKAHGDFPAAEILDPVFYGRNLRARVKSRTEDNVMYDYNWSRLPMHRRGDQAQYSDWINMACTSNDPDMVFRGEQHEKRVLPVHLFSAGAVFAFYEAMNHAKKIGDFRQFRVNPFSIPVNAEATDYIDNLRLRSFILKKGEDTEALSLRVLNKAEIDRFTGARTHLRGYNNCWYHWGSKNSVNFLYTPKK